MFGQTNIPGPNPTFSHTERGNINHNIVNAYYENGPRSRDIPLANFEALLGHVSREALHSYRKVPDAPMDCPGTRAAILESVHRWAAASECTPRIQWIYATEHSGQSTLLRTVADMLEQHGLLLASFFFSGVATHRNNADCFVPTIAYQISCSIPTALPHIDRAIGKDRLILCTRGLREQARAFIVDPITQAYQENVTGKQYPRIIIIDGLNGEEETRQREVLRALKMISKVPIPISFLLASRPEPHLLAFFGSELTQLSEPSTRLAPDESGKDDKDIHIEGQICEVCEHRHLARSQIPGPRSGMTAPPENQKLNEKLSENAQTAVPQTTQYIMANSGKNVLTLLQFAAGVIPAPLLREAIGVALNIIELCEEASAVEGKVKELQDRVGNLMMVVVANVTAKKEEDCSEAVVKAAKGIEEDIKGLLGPLKTINRALTEISVQNRWLTAFYTEPDVSMFGDCMDWLSTTLEKFKLTTDLRDYDLLQELGTRLGNLMANKVDKISKGVEHRGQEFHEVLARLERPTTPLSETVAREEIPMKPSIFHGRDGLVEEIVQWLMKGETSRVCILGPGGMGKTSVLLAVVESPPVQARFPGGNIVWVPCVGATSATLLLEILYVQLQIPGDRQVMLEKIISELSTFMVPRLILLDNFETPWNAPGGTQKQVEHILRQLAQLNHVAIFITMRGSYPPPIIKWQSKNIQPTDEAACLRIFHETNPSSKNDPDVSRLLSTLGHMPFAVTLMANLGKEGHSTAHDLLDAWSKFGPDIISDNPEQSMNRTIQLSVNSHLIKGNPNALLLLAILSLLPAGTKKENLRWWAPTLMVPSAIAALSKAALLVINNRQDSDSQILFVVPVVQSFMQQHDRISHHVRKQIHLSCCQYVLDHACRYDDIPFPAKSKALAAEDANIQSILFHSPRTQHTDPSDITMEALTAFNWHRCDTKPSLEIASHVVVAAKARHIERHMASALWCLGRTYFQLSDYALSYDRLQEAYRLFNALPPGDLGLQRLGSHCGIDLVDTARLIQDGAEVVSLARDVEQKCAVSDNPVLHGRSLVFVGTALQEAQQPQEALHYLNRALTMLKAVKNAPNLAEAYQVIARVHYDQGRLTEALDAINEAWEHAEASNSPYIQAVVSLDFAEILFWANRDMEAWKYTEIALMKASHVGTQTTAAAALEYMGRSYLRRGDYQNAYHAYEAAADKYPAIYPGSAERCKNNLARIERKQRTPDAVVGFQRHSYDLDGSLFFPPVHAFASDLPASSS